MDPNHEQPMNSTTVGLLASYLLLVVALSIYLIVSLWPDPRRVDTAPAPQPDCSTVKAATLTNIYPAPVYVGLPGDLLLIGCQFPATTTVKINGSLRQAQVVDAGHVRLGLSAADVSAVGVLIVTMSDGGKEYESGTVNVSQASFRWALPGGIIVTLHPEVQLLLIVLFTGALGAAVYALKSLADYRGENRLFDSWRIFYVIQPFVGMGIAFLFYVVVRAGFLGSGTVDTAAVNKFGICAIAGLVGAFADTAFLKLREVFQAMFKPQDDRGGKITLKITTASLPNAVVGTPYRQALHATGGVAPLKWSVTPALPAGLTLAEDGVIAGTAAAPAAPATFKFTVTDNATPAASTSVDVQFAVVKASLEISPATLPAATVGVAYNQSLKATAAVGPVEWTVAPALPAGLTLTRDTGVLSGIPTTSIPKTPFKFTVVDRGNAGASATATIDLQIAS